VLNGGSDGASRPYGPRGLCRAKYTYGGLMEDGLAIIEPGRNATLLHKVAQSGRFERIVLPFLCQSPWSKPRRGTRCLRAESGGARQITNHGYPVTCVGDFCPVPARPRPRIRGRNNHYFDRGRNGAPTAIALRCRAAHVGDSECFTEEPAASVASEHRCDAGLNPLGECR
jgi:hypothetical protein